MEQTSTQKLFWDSDDNVVWGALDSTPQTLQTAQENRFLTRMYAA